MVWQGLKVILRIRKLRRFISRSLKFPFFPWKGQEHSPCSLGGIPNIPLVPLEWSRTSPLFLRKGSSHPPCFLGPKHPSCFLGKVPNIPLVPLERSLTSPLPRKGPYDIPLVPWGKSLTHPLFPWRGP